MATTDRDTNPIPPSGAYKLFNVGVQEFAIEGSAKPHSDYVVMVSVQQEKWLVEYVGDSGKYTIQSQTGKYSFVPPPVKEGEVVDLGTTKYEWYIELLRQDKNLYYCRIWTKATDDSEEKLYWRAKLEEGKFAGVVYLSSDADKNTEWIFDNGN